jgi:hypothetical protein
MVRQTSLKIAWIQWNLWLSKRFWLAQFDTAGALVPLLVGQVQQTCSIIVGNQTVVKNLPIQFNQGFNGQAFDRLHENRRWRLFLMLNTAANCYSAQTLISPVEIRLLTDIVIPPQVAFEVRIESNAGVYGTGAVVCALSGYGKIFSAGMSF